MFHFQTKFEGRDQILSASDKIFLLSNADVISNELLELYVLLNGNDYISRKNRRMLETAIHLANIFGYSSNENHQAIIKDLDAPMASNSHLKKALKLSIMPYLEFLKEKVDSIVTNTDLSDKLALLDIGSKTEDPLLKLNDFDKFLSKKRPGVDPGFAKILNENKVWKATVNIKDQIINLWGELPEDEFKRKGVIPDEFVKYIQSKFPIRESRDDSAHMGCSLLNCQFFRDARDNLLPEVKEALGIFNSESDSITCKGTAGIFVYCDKVHYLVTAAHVVFPELTDLKFDSNETQLDIFNAKVPFAKYDSEFDIAMVPLKSYDSHCNSFRIAPIDCWGYPDSNKKIVKIGASSGITVGKIHELNTDLIDFEFFNLVSVKEDEKNEFACPGDSGSGYYQNSKHGYVPIALHKTSTKTGASGNEVELSGDKLILISYGFQFLKNFSAILDKQNLDIDSFKPCQLNQSGLECAKSHIKEQIN